MLAVIFDFRPLWDYKKVYIMVQLFHFIFTELHLKNNTVIKLIFTNRPSDRVRKKMENYAEIIGNIMRKKVTIMRKRRQIMQKFLTSYREFNLFMTCLTFCCHSWTGISSFIAVFP